MSIGDFAQTVGIARTRQLGDERDAQQARILEQQIEQQQAPLDLARILKMALPIAVNATNAEQAAADAKAGKGKRSAAVTAPTAPTAPDALPQEMADGGEIDPLSKFDGIYDDTKVKGRMPTMVRDWASHIMDHQNYAPHVDGTRARQTARELMGHVRAYVDGGDIYNGVPMAQQFADGGQVDDDTALKDYGMSFAEGRLNYADGGGIGNFINKKRRKPAVKMKKGGGPVSGPGTGTSDSVKAVGPGNAPYRLSDGEYVLSADTVAAVGKHNLDALQARYHKKVG